MQKQSESKLSDLITIRPIKTEADYEAALAEVAQLMGNVEPDTPEGNKLELLITLLGSYEDIHYPMGETSDPISIIEFVMEQQGLNRKDLEPYIGPRQRVWDIMERRRPLSLTMIRNLAETFNIPSDILLSEYTLYAKVA